MCFTDQSSAFLKFQIQFSVFMSFLLITVLTSSNTFRPPAHLPPCFSGKHGIICLEDLIHEIYSVGKSFVAANNFLLPFRLSVPRHAARDKAGLLKDLGNPGFRGTDINSIIRLLNWAKPSEHGHWARTSRGLFVGGQMKDGTKLDFSFLINVVDFYPVEFN